ncbi:MAG: OmpA family protein, partial [Bacteroidota bacterium]|nr:OmpA family protein [Bacteroidota bacterium]
AFQHAQLKEWYFALPLYIKLTEQKPENADFAFNTGQCYFNTDNKAKGLEYFKIAAKQGHKSQLLDFYLGRAYHFNLIFDSALFYYNQYLKYYKKDNFEEDIFSTHNPTPAEVARFIENCNMGQKLVNNPVELRIENIGPIVNTKFPEYVPVVSADEKILMFTTRRNTTTGKGINEEGRYYEDIFISTKNEIGEWQEPVSVGPPINTKFDDACIGLSHDGKKLLIFNGINGGDIFLSEQKNNAWSRPKRLEGDINTTYWEGSASFSIDEGTIYFSSDRLGGMGGSDIYYSKKQANGTWGKAVNLGAAINTPYDEDAPQIHVDGKTLFFSSKGHEGMGGFDIFSSSLNLADSTWSRPKNIGYPINTADDDIYFSLTADGSKGFFTSYRMDGYGEQDIYIMHRPLSSPTHVLLKGKIMDELNNPLAAYITLTRQKDQVIEKMTKSDPKTGSYSFEMEFDKEYNLTVEAEGFFYFTENINIGKQPDIFEYVMNFNSGKNNIFVVEVFEGSEAAATNKTADLNAIKSSNFIEKKLHNDNTAAVAKNKNIAGNIAILDEKPKENYSIALTKTLDNPTVQTRTLVPLEVGKKMTLHNIYFDFNKSTLKFESTTELNNLYKLLNTHKSIHVEISGHTDNTGRKKYNQNLSEARAKAVYDFLINKGIEEDRLNKVGYGDTRPQVSNLTPEGRKINRRTEFEIKNLEKSTDGLITYNSSDIESVKSFYRRKDNNVETLLPFKAHFLYNDGKYLTEYSKLRLNTLIELAKKENDMKLVIVGYEDLELENPAKLLSKERAQTVYNYLISNGISTSIVEIKVSDNSRKIAANEKGIKRRKVEFYLVNK